MVCANCKLVLLTRDIEMARSVKPEQPVAHLLRISGIHDRVIAERIRSVRHRDRTDAGGELLYDAYTLSIGFQRVRWSLRSYTAALSGFANFRQSQTSSSTAHLRLVAESERRVAYGSKATLT